MTKKGSILYHREGPLLMRAGCCGQTKRGRAVLLPDWEIERLVEKEGMIAPFEKGQVRHDGENRPIISYGLSSYGYDLRVGSQFKIFTNVRSSIVDPKHFCEEAFIDIDEEVCIIPPNSFALAVSVEYFRIPRDLLTLCIGKSTYARCGIIVNVTPFEPEWEGYVTIEISNTTPLPAKIYAHEGIAQVLFLRGSGVCQTSYLDRGGKYMRQAQTVTLPTL